MGVGAVIRVHAAALAVAAGAVAVPGAAAASPEPAPAGLVNAAVQRLLTADAVAAAKWGTDSPVADSARAAHVLDAVAAQAGARGVDPEFARRVFRDQIDATEAVEYARFAQWSLHPDQRPVVRPDLSAVRTRIDQLTTRMIDELAADPGTLRSPGCPVLLLGARVAAVARYRLAPPYLEALVRATQGYCLARPT
ncbi:MAG: chorismate mutase [Mycobacteriaceae bacterium]|nr:chorismate mutase [Mycobacteriaceae bacterium]